MILFFFFDMYELVYIGIGIRKIRVWKNYLINFVRFMVIY